MTRHTLAKHLAQGAPYVTRANRERGVEWEIAIGPVSDWLVQRATDHAIARHEGAADGGMTRAEADRRRAVALAISAERETEELLRSLVPITDAREQVAKEYARIRNAFHGLGARVAQQAALMTSAPEIQALVDQEIVTTVENLTDAGR